MDILRNKFDNFYDKIKPLVFKLTKNDPEYAHEAFVLGMKMLKFSGLENVVLGDSSNKIDLPFDFSNAAGFNKNGEIHPKILQLLGFNRVTIGTVTNDEWRGNPRQRIWRYIDTKTLVNCIGLAGIGSKNVSKNLLSYGKHGVPLTINIMSTPQKEGNNLLKDLRGTILDTKYVDYVDRYEVNISCPNTHTCKNGSLDARNKNMAQSNRIFELTDSLIKNQEVYVKLSPDMDFEDINIFFDIIKNHRIHGFTLVNTTTEHNKDFIKNSPGMGGGSGACVYDKGEQLRDYVGQKIVESKRDYKIQACGGIDSIKKIDDALKSDSVTGIQILTPLIFEGTKYPKEINKHYNLK